MVYISDVSYTSLWFIVVMCLILVYGLY